MAIGKATWDIILKAIIAVASAVLGALGANAMNLQTVHKVNKKLSISRKSFEQEQNTGKGLPAFI